MRSLIIKQQGLGLIEVMLVITISLTLLLMGLYFIQKQRYRLDLLALQGKIHATLFAMTDYYNSDCQPTQSPILASTSLQELAQQGFLSEKIAQQMQQNQYGLTFHVGMQKEKSVNVVYVSAYVKNKKQVHFLFHQLAAQKIKDQTLYWYQLPSLMRQRFNDLGQRRFKKVFSPNGVCRL